MPNSVNVHTVVLILIIDVKVIALFVCVLMEVSVCVLMVTEVIYNKNENNEKVNYVYTKQPTHGDHLWYI